MKQSPERQQVLDKIVTGLVDLIKKRAKQPLIGILVRKEIESFRQNTKTHNLNGSQVGEVALMIFNELNEIINRPPIQNPNPDPPTQEVLDTTGSTMTSVNKILNMRRPIPKLCKIGISKLIDDCEERIRQHNVTSAEIEQIGEKTWKRVKNIVE
jgi:hypothetical protein